MRVLSGRLGALEACRSHLARFGKDVGQDVELGVNGFAAINLIELWNARNCTEGLVRVLSRTSLAGQYGANLHMREKFMCRLSLLICT